MKKIYLLLSFCLIHFITQAQSPQGIPYQSVIRNGSGNLLINQSVQVRFTIHDSTMSGNIIYQETHASNTSAAAMLILTIGQGTPVIGNFSTINWGNGAKFMQVELDAAGGSNYTDLGTQQMMSVPYALYAKTAGSISLPPGASQGQVLTYCDGNYIWTNGGICPGSIASLNCSYSNNTGTLIANSQANNVSSIISYNGGNGGTYATQSVSSIGVTGLTATLAAGTLANGSGTITYSITGTPNGAGTASFQLNIGVQGCILNWIVDSQPAYPAGSIFCNGSPTLLVDVTNPATGKIWMDRNLGATQVAISSTDANAYGDLYQWGRGSDGHQCRNSQSISASTPMNTNLSSTDQPGHGYFIITGSYTSDWREPQNNNLWQGVNGINNPCPSGYRIPTDAELDAERLSWSSNDINAAFASPLKFSLAGYRIRSMGVVISGNEGDYWSSTVIGSNARHLSVSAGNSSLVNYYRGNGHSVRCIKEATAPVGTINTLDCNGATNSGTLTSGILATGVNSSISYSGGNGGIYPAQTIASTGVTGLTATLSAGILTNSNGNLTYTISGIPNGSGTASFAINIGGQNCILNRNVQTLASLYPAGSVFCNGTPTLVVDVTNPITGETWMDRNLGATQVATSSTDANAYGDLYQWGRGSDGHQCRNSSATSILSSTDQPGHGNYISDFSGISDWRSPQNDNLWQGLNGINNPCPSGYRIPLQTELNAVNNSGTLGLPLAGGRSSSTGLIYVGTFGMYWSSNVNSVYSRFLDVGHNIANAGRVWGLSIRCIKD
jgi:hypothetical protein